MNVFAKVQRTITSREFKQNRAKVKREAKKGPVVITERGVPSLVVMTVEEFETLKARGATPPSQPDRPFRSLADALAQTEGGDFDFDIPEFKGTSLRPADLG